MAKKPWTPLRTALWAFLVALVLATIILVLTLPRKYGEEPFDNGARVGDLAAKPAIAVGIATYLIMWARKRKGG